MRNAIRDHLLSNISSLQDVFEPHAATKQSPKPYAVVKQGVDSEDSDWLGFRRIIEIWPYQERTSFTEIDELVNEIANSLDKTLLTTSDGTAFSCMYLGTDAQDFVDDEWDAITRPIKFAVVAVQPVNINESVASDPWVEALSLWTEKLFNSQTTDWMVYRQQLPVGFMRPCVLWRVDDYRAESMTRSGFKIRKQIKGHVIGVSPNQQSEAISDIVMKLNEEIKVSLNSSERKFLTVDQARASINVSEFNQGQITLDVSRNTSRIKDDAPVMTYISGSGSIKGGGSIG